MGLYKACPEIHYNVKGTIQNKLTYQSCENHPNTFMINTEDDNNNFTGQNINF